MASVTGTSGAWKEVYDQLREEGVPVSHPRQIQTELDKIRNGYNQQVAQFFVDVANEIAAFEQQVVATQFDVQQRIERKQFDTAQTIATYNARLEQLRQATGFFQRLLNRLKIQAVEYQRQGAESRLRRDIASLGKTVADAQHRLNNMKANKASLVNIRRENLDRTISRLEGILHSKELAGAQAEMEAVDRLATGGGAASSPDKESG